MRFTRNLFSFFLACALIMGLVAAASAADRLPAKVNNGVLVGPSGMTLYIFDKDEAGSGKSECNGPCAVNWPPLLAGEKDRSRGKGTYTVIKREDGKKQWAYKGKPLYYWIKDSKPGDRTGDGFNKVWRVATP